MKTVLITGATRGLGLGLVKKLLQSGEDYRIIATYRSLSSASELTSLQSQYAERLQIFSLDVTSKTSHEELKKTLVSKGINTLDVVIANAGIVVREDTSALTTSAEHINEVFQTNVIGAMLTLQTFADLTTASATRLFVVISSIMGSIAHSVEFGGVPSYRMSKAAINSFAATFSTEAPIKASGSKILCVHPGWVQTDMGGANAPLTTEQSMEGLAQVLAAAVAHQTDAATAASKVSPAYQPLLGNIAAKDCVFVGYDGKAIEW